MNIQDFIIRLSVSFLLAFLIGFERQYRRRSVGFRTYALVCIGAFLFVTFSVQTKLGDYSRIAAQVVSGIGFLGAGVILKDGNNIKGLNTAATLWCSAAIGILCATGLLLEATLGTVFILFSNIILRFIGRKLDETIKHKMEENYIITVKCYKENNSEIRSVISKSAVNNILRIKNIECTNYKGDVMIIKANITILANNNHLLEKLINQLNLKEGILSLGWDRINDQNKDDIDEEI